MAGNNRAGALRTRVACQMRATVADDGYGNTLAAAWTTQFTVWAGYQHLRGGETVLAARLENRHPMLVTLRATDDTRRITADWRLVDCAENDVMAVRDVTHETDGKWITLLVERGVAA
jgi:head-tail adaptor